MAYYHTCPDCGANLDPGETCDCTRVPIPTPAAAPAFLSVADAANRWAVSVDLVYDLIRSGTLPALKLGGTTWRIPVSGVQAYEAANLSGANSDGPRQKPSARRRKPVLRL